MITKIRNNTARSIIHLHEYQIQAVDFAKQTFKCGLFLDLGLGKTLISLIALEDLYHQDFGHILIIAPKAIAKTTWLSEIQKWNIEIPCESLICNEKGKSLSRKKRLEAYRDVVRNPVRTIYLINRELISDLVENLPLNADGQPIWAFQTIIVDEFQSFKSSTSERFQALKKVSCATQRLIGLTGTPAPQGIEDLWSEIYLMDYGQRLGSTLTAFRKTYMIPDFFHPLTRQPVAWKAAPGAEDKVYSRVNDIVISMKNKLKLPEMTEIFDYVYLDETEFKNYRKLASSGLLEFARGDAATGNTPAVLTNRLQQMASGTVYTVDADDKPTGEYAKLHSRKLDMLKYIRDNTDDNLLVAYYFNSDLSEISAFLDKNKIPYVIYDASKSAEIQKEWDANKIPLLLIHPASAGFGLNLQYSGRRLIWYTLSFNLEQYTQTIGRIHRQGQTRPVFIHYLLTAKTIDERVLAALKQKDCSQQAMLDALDYAKFNLLETKAAVISSYA